jgi:hypothetical protein
MEALFTATDVLRAIARHLRQVRGDTIWPPHAADSALEERVENVIYDLLGAVLVDASTGSDSHEELRVLLVKRDGSVLSLTRAV